VPPKEWGKFQFQGGRLWRIPGYYEHEDVRGEMKDSAVHGICFAWAKMATLYRRAAVNKGPLVKSTVVQFTLYCTGTLH
jgi:hypothetical protein